ncbi:MAG: carboxynorspermidine decarboxylase [Eubacteriales bacterium]|nr:carboxynorspermidine decarboxylase [Eubacteriales bacterium]
MPVDFDGLPTPCYVIDTQRLENNLRILKGVSEKCGARILLAQKAFSMFAVYPLIKRYLDGTAASGLYEARLGYEEMGGENHVFSPAYRDHEIDEIITYCDHIIFNSFSQFYKYRDRVLRAGREIGLRINPECSTQKGQDIYDPCAPRSRLGITAASFRGESVDGVSGIHFHTLCEQNADALAQTLEAVEAKFGPYLSRVKWINFGGGHHITREDYDIPLLLDCVNRFTDKYGVSVYLEPGEAIAFNAGYLVTTVVDIVYNGFDIAILDASAACHMPDVLEMPYRPPLFGSGEIFEKQHTYRLGGPTCLAGDIIGDYSFDEPLRAGDRLVFGDMAIYTMVKNNTFNGMPLPAIILREADGGYRTIRSFGYHDYKNRLS